LIVWDPIGLVTSRKKDAATMQSPAIALAHEMGHGVQWVKNRGWYLAYVNQVLNGDAQKSGSPAYNAKLVIENDNIQTHETPVAQELSEGIRKDYNDAADFSQAKKNYKAPYPLLPLGHG